MPARHKRRGTPSQIALVALIACTTLFSGCRRDPNVRKQKYLESGKRYEDQGKYREAAIQFSNALKVDHNFAAAHFELAKTYISLGSVVAGYQELLRTVSLDPNNVEARTNLGGLLLAGGLPDKAMEQAKAILALQPNNAEAYALEAYVDQKKGDLPDALTQIQHAIQLDPNKSAFHTAYGLMQAASSGQAQQGQTELQKAISLNPKDATAHLAYANVLARDGNLSGAEQQLQSAVQNAPQNLQARIALAELYMHQNAQKKAEDVLVQGVNVSPDKDQPAEVLLAFYARTNQIAKAEQTFGNLYGSHKQSVPVAAQYARVLMMDGKFDQANDVLKDVSKSNGNSPQIQRLNADMLLHQGKANDAFVLLQKAVSGAPDDVRLRLLLAQTAMGLNKNSVAESNLQDALRLDPRNLEAARGLVVLASAHGDLGQVDQLAQSMITAHPDAPDGYIWRGTAEGNRNELDAAEKDFQTALQKAPGNEAASLNLGELRLKQKRTPEGQTLLQQVLAKNPNNITALNLLVSLDLQAGKTQDAMTLIQDQIAKSPNNPALYTDLAAVQMQLKDFAGAQGSAQHALGLAKGYAPAVQLYSQAQVAQGNTDGAIATWQQWLTAHPDDARANTLIGSLEQTKGDVSKAMDYYKKALQMDSSQAVAANNLAYLMVENGENSDVALSYAESARRLLPNSPDTADTLAWVYYHKGTYSLARDLLEDAAKAEPNNASIHYHLGMTYTKMGNKTDAATQLKKAADLAPNTQTGKDANDALSHLG